VDLDLKRVNLGQQIAAIGAVLLFIFLFIGWYTVGGALGAFADQLGVNVSLKGWDAHTLLRWLMLLTIVAAIGLAFLSATKRSIPGLPVTASTILTALAALTTLLLAFRMFINQPRPDKLIDLKFGVWLGLLSLVAITLGGWLSMRAEGTSVRAAGDQVRKAVETATHKEEPPAAPTS
jgi:cation transport ATPase